MASKRLIELIKLVERVQHEMGYGEVTLTFKIHEKQLRSVEQIVTFNEKTSTGEMRSISTKKNIDLR